ncbi:YdcF family protein [Pseudaestuariivita atlantica]|uniref:YdcF family protein n=1 Tax=Pseudaestuariivita atlantica TaxID=1317121 RepID=UPI00067CD12D|nr:YdcF family protein [Pseudaestuariivita atlantica]
MRHLRRILIGVALVAATFVAPWAWLWATTPVARPADAPPVEAALIFGALVRDGRISPLHAERLDTGRTLWATGKADRIVVSNAHRAALAMARHLEEAGVPPDVIEIDSHAPSTPDTCANEAARPEEPRRVAFVSQRFHLPRIRLHCAPLALDAVYVAADDPARPRADVSTLVRVRGYRFLRENLLTWAVLLRLYPSG